MSQADRDFVHFGTQRDWRAIQEAIKRSELGNKDPGVVSVEPVENADKEITCCHHYQDSDRNHHDCDRPADVRVVRNRSQQFDEDLEPDGPAKVYSDPFCLPCFESELHDWIDAMVTRVADNVVDARDGGQNE